MVCCTRVPLFTSCRPFNPSHSGSSIRIPQRQSGWDYQRLPTCQIHGHFSLTLCMNVAQLMSESNLNVFCLVRRKSSFVLGGMGMPYENSRWGKVISPVSSHLLLPSSPTRPCSSCLAFHQINATTASQSIWPCDNHRPWLGTPHHAQTANNHLFFPSVTHKETTLASFNFYVLFFFSIVG